MSNTINSAMSEMSPDMKDFLEAWSLSLRAVMGQIAGASVDCESSMDVPAGFRASDDTDFWLIAALTGPLSGELAFRFPSPSARQIARFFMSESRDDETELTPEYSEAVLELFRQIAGQAATKLKAKWKDVQVRTEPGSAPTWAPASSCWFSMQIDRPVALELRISAALAAILRPRQNEKDSLKNGTVPGSMDMLLDVELDVSMRFGSRRMLLKDILDLCSGSVVELDQQLQEPVDLLLDGKVIARGEVVVVDGNYGLRVTELATAAAN
jgi:flagellar motor switch protein FliN